MRPASIPACSLQPQPTRQPLEARLCTQRGEDRVNLEEDTSAAVRLMALEPVERFVSLTQPEVYGGELRRRDVLALLASLTQLGENLSRFRLLSGDGMGIAQQGGAKEPEIIRARVLQLTHCFRNIGPTPDRLCSAPSEP